MPSWWLGIDPARTGAALLLDPTLEPLVAYCWRPRQRGGVACFQVVVVTAEHGRKVIAPDFHRISMEISSSVGRVTVGEPWGVATEAPYVSRINPGTGLQVAISTGELVGPLRGQAAHPLLLVKASEWRSQLLALSRTTGREAAKAASLTTMPARLPGLQLLLERVAALMKVEPVQLDHVTDAAGVAEYGYLHGEENTDG